MPPDALHHGSSTRSSVHPSSPGTLPSSSPQNCSTTSAEPLADLLRRCKVLAARLKNTEFASWVSRELNGYVGTDELPPYRVIRTPHSIGYFAGAGGTKAENVPLPLSRVPQEVRDRVTRWELRQGIGELQELVKHSDLTVPWPADFILVCQRRFFEDLVLVGAEIKLGPAMLAGVLDTVRTRVLDFVLAIQAENPDAGESALSSAPPIPPHTLHQVFHNTIIGGNANIGVAGTATIDNSDVQNAFTLDEKKEAVLGSLLSQAATDAAGLPEEERTKALATIEEVKAAAKENRITADGVRNWTTALTGVVTAATAAAPGVTALNHWLTSLFQ